MPDRVVWVVSETADLLGFSYPLEFAESGAKKQKYPVSSGSEDYMARL